MSHAVLYDGEVFVKSPSWQSKWTGTYDCFNETWSSLSPLEAWNPNTISKLKTVPSAYLPYETRNPVIDESELAFQTCFVPQYYGQGTVASNASTYVPIANMVNSAYYGSIPRIHYKYLPDPGIVRYDSWGYSAYGVNNAVHVPNVFKIRSWGHHLNEKTPYRPYSDTVSDVWYTNALPIPAISDLGGFVVLVFNDIDDDFIPTGVWAEYVSRTGEAPEGTTPGNWFVPIMHVVPRTANDINLKQIRVCAVTGCFGGFGTLTANSILDDDLSNWSWEDGRYLARLAGVCVHSTNKPLYTYQRLYSVSLSDPRIHSCNYKYAKAYAVRPGITNSLDYANRRGSQMAYGQLALFEPESDRAASFVTASIGCALSYVNSSDSSVDEGLSLYQDPLDITYVRSVNGTNSNFGVWGVGANPHTLGRAFITIPANYGGYQQMMYNQLPLFDN